jgi:hypothetical protein
MDAGIRLVHGRQNYPARMWDDVSLSGALQIRDEACEQAAAVGAAHDVFDVKPCTSSAR